MLSEYFPERSKGHNQRRSLKQPKESKERPESKPETANQETNRKPNANPIRIWGIRILSHYRQNIEFGPMPSQRKLIVAWVIYSAMNGITTEADKREKLIYISC